VKSQKVCELLSAMSAIMVDVYSLRAIGEMDQSESQEWEKDWASIAEVVKDRGVSILLVDGPDMAKHLLRCIVHGSLIPLPGNFWARGLTESTVPHRFAGLWREVFDASGALRLDGAGGRAVRDLRQLYACLKKMDIDCPVEAINQEVDSFQSVDRSLPRPSPYWETGPSGDRSGSVAHCSFTWNGDVADRAVQLNLVEFAFEFLPLLDHVSGLVMQALGQYDWSQWKFGHGPGCVADLSKGGYKYAFPTWSQRLDSCFPYEEVAFSNLTSWANVALDDCIGFSGWHLADTIEPWSRLDAVPKDMTKPRLIAYECTANMFCQKNIFDYMVGRTEVSWLGDFVKFRDQSLNQRLARESSAHGRLATVDLSAASDRVTCTVVESWARSNLGLLDALCASRTRRCVLLNGDILYLNKYATMGNATTFSVESLLFLTISIAAVLHARSQKASLKNVRALAGEVAVYGDDIVVPVDCRSSFERAMDLLWFKVNADKTFWTSKFRESCGIDAYDGEDVTPAYIRSLSNETPDEIASLVEQANNFYSKYLLRSAGFLADQIGMALPLRSVSSGVFGLSCRTGPSFSAFRRRWNWFLQIDEVKVPCLSSRQAVTPVNHEFASFQFFTEIPDPLSSWASGIKRRPDARIASEWVDLRLFN